MAKKKPDDNPENAYVYNKNGSEIKRSER